MRLHHVQTLKQAGETVYPHKYHVSISLRDFIDKYSHLQNEEINNDVVSVAGKIEFNFNQKNKCIVQDVSIQNVHREPNFISMIFMVIQLKFKSWLI
jgi:lysyl-tRNA synthetase class 2